MNIYLNIVLTFIFIFDKILITMKQLKTRKDFLLFLFYLVIIVLLILSSFLPFVQKDYISVYLAHFFNPTAHEFSGKFESAYGFILPIIAFISLIVDWIDLKENEYKKTLFNTVLKASLLCSFVFTVMNYFRVIYPNGFLVSGDVSFLYSGFYFFILFLIALFILVIMNCTYLYQERKLRVESSVSTYDSKRKKYYVVISTFLLISLFCFVSLLFVPFVRNYQNYMIEPGFAEILDKRTSIDYYIFSMFDRDFNLNIMTLTLIYISILTPAAIFLAPKKTTYILISISAIFNIIFYSIALIVASETYQQIKPLLYLTYDTTAIVFLAINLFSQLMLIIFCSMQLNYRRKDMKNVARNVDQI